MAKGQNVDPQPLISTIAGIGILLWTRKEIKRVLYGDNNQPYGH